MQVMKKMEDLFRLVKVTQKNYEAEGGGVVGINLLFYPLKNSDTPFLKNYGKVRQFNQKHIFEI